MLEFLVYGKMASIEGIMLKYQLVWDVSHMFCSSMVNEHTAALWEAFIMAYSALNTGISHAYLTLQNRNLCCSPR